MAGLSPKMPLKTTAIGMRAGKEQDRKVAIANMSTWGFSQATTQLYRTSGTAATVIFCTTRPQSSTRIEVSASCLPLAGYARCRGREQSQKPYCCGIENPHARHAPKL